jgi:hypothetical protein
VSASAVSAPPNQSILFQRPPWSFDLDGGGVDTGAFGPDMGNLVEPGLPLSKSGERFFPPPPPNQRAQTHDVAQVVAPGLDGLITDDAHRWSHVPGALLDLAATVLPALKAPGLALGLGERLAAREAQALIESGELVTGPYGQLRGRLPWGWQAHHVNQNAVFGKIVPRKSGFSVGMRGSIFSQPGTPHYNFHRSMEEFWNQYRARGAQEGITPTIAEFHQAAERAFVAAGFTPEQASGLVAQAATDLTSRGVSLAAEVPRIPGKIWRLWPY